MYDDINKNELEEELRISNMIKVLENRLIRQCCTDAEIYLIIDAVKSHVLNKAEKILDNNNNVKIRK